MNAPHFTSFDDLTTFALERSWHGRLLARLGPPVYVLADRDGFRFRCEPLEVRVAAIAHVSWQAPRVLAVGDQATPSAPSRRVDLFGSEFEALPEARRLEWMTAFLRYGLRGVSPRGALLRPEVVSAGLEELPGHVGREFWTQAFTAAGARALYFAAPAEYRAA